MNQRNRIFAGCIFALMLLLWACSPSEEPVEPPESIVIEQSGMLAFPSGSALNLESLSVIGVSGTANPSASGSFTVDILKGYYSFIYVNSPNDKMVAAAYVKSSATPTINESSTALAILMMFPIAWGEAGLTQEALLSELQLLPDFPLLVSYIQNVMINDPEGLMDYSAHPAILETACNIVAAFSSQHGLLQAAKEEQNKLKGTSSYLRVEDVAGNPNVHVTNWWVTPYGMSSFELTKNAHQKASYDLMNKLPYYVNPLGLKWWVIPSPAEADYPLGDGNYVLMLSKTDPWALTAFGPIVTLSEYVDKCDGLTEGDYIKVLQADARIKAFMGSMVFITARALGIVAVVDPTEVTGFAKIALESGPKAAELIAGIIFADEDWVDLGIQKSKTKAIKWLARIAAKNASVITKWASGLGIKLATASLKQAINNFSWVMGAVDAVGDVALLILYATDTFFADQDLVYFVTQMNGNASIIASTPPTAPSIAGPTSGTTGTPYSFTVNSTDPDGDQIRYLIQYGDGTSGQSSFVTSGFSQNFSHSFAAGNYPVYCYSVDDQGATSALSAPHRISVSPVGGFLEDFESYQVGGFESTGVWTVNYLEPSRVFISDVGMQSARSIKFIDYDPSIGEESGHYATALAYTVGNPTSVEFYIRVDNAADAFGVRTWGTSGVWSTMGYYVIVDRGWLKWVRMGSSAIDDTSDFIPIRQIQPLIWYKISLSLNWPAQSYAISVNDELVTQGATFVAYNRGYSLASAPTLQLVAFTDAQCRSAYVDNISLAGATLGAIRINEASNSQSAVSITDKTMQQKR